MFCLLAQLNASALLAAVAGLAPRRGDHAPAALRFALDMLAEAALVDVDEADGRKVQLRVGMHAGPVTAGLSAFPARV